MNDSIKVGTEMKRFVLFMEGNSCVCRTHQLAVEVLPDQVNISLHPCHLLKNNNNNNKVVVKKAGHRSG